MKQGMYLRPSCLKFCILYPALTLITRRLRILFGSFGMVQITVYTLCFTKRESVKVESKVSEPCRSFNNEDMTHGHFV